MNFTPVDIVLRLVLGVAIGFSIGLTGIGGGVLVLPSLTLILGLPASVAVGTASLYAFLTKLLATYQHFKLKNVDLQISSFLLLGAIPANVIISFWINHYVANAQDDKFALGAFQHDLKNFMALVILASVVVIVFNLVFLDRKDGKWSVVQLAERLEGTPHLRKSLAVLSGVVVGALIGATSVGGGVIIVPLLIIIFGLSSRKTVGTSIFVALALTLLTALVYGKGNQMDFLSAFIMAAGSLVSVGWGSRLSVRMPERPLQGIMAGVIFASALLMVLKQTY